METIILIRQGGSSLQFRRFPAPMRRRILGYERFSRAEPSPDGRRIYQQDLFEGVNP